MTTLRLDHLNMRVRSFEDTAAWYHSVFDFQVVERGVVDGRPWGVLKAGDAMLCVYESPDMPQPRREDRVLNHFAIAVNDREAWLARAKQLGLALGYGGEVRWDHSSAWYVRDPSGYEVEVAIWDDRPRFSAS